MSIVSKDVLSTKCQGSASLKLSYCVALLAAIEMCDFSNKPPKERYTATLLTFSLDAWTFMAVIIVVKLAAKHC